MNGSEAWTTTTKETNALRILSEREFLRKMCGLVKKEERWRIRTKNYTKDILKVEKKTSVALVRERTIPTERPPPVGEVSANFCG